MVAICGAVERPMVSEEWAHRWRALSDEVLTAMQAWRADHPRATFREIEAAVEDGISRLRARMLEEAALTSAARDWAGTAPAERPRCPECQQPLGARGQETRTLTVPGEQAVRLQRRYGVCPACGAGLFPPR